MIGPLHDLRPLVDAHSPFEKAAPQAERQARRLHGRIQSVERRAPEERRGAARADLLRAHGDDLVRRAELAARADLVVPRPELRRGRRNLQHRRLSVPRIDVVVAAPGADPPHGVLGRAAHGEGRGDSRSLPERVDVAPERLAEPSVPPARAVPAHGGLEYDHVELRARARGASRRSRARGTAPPTTTSARRVPLERPAGHHRARLLEPPPVPRVVHAGSPRYAACPRARQRVRQPDEQRGRDRRNDHGHEEDPADDRADRDEGEGDPRRGVLHDRAGDDERRRAPRTRPRAPCRRRPPRRCR